MRRSWTSPVTGLLLALLLLLPLLGPGYVLVRDMVFVPRVPLRGQLLGLSGVPRAVPSDLAVALLSRVVPAGWLQDLVLLGIVVLGAWGAARAVPTDSRLGALAAATSYGWSPFLHERLLLGQWALLLGWAALPWAAAAAVRWRAGGPVRPVVLACAAAAVGGASALLLVGLVVAVCGRTVRAVALTALLSLPWAVPALLQHQVAGDPAGVGAFAARSDTPFGVVGSLLTGGGAWAREAAPPGRSAGSWIALLLVVVALTGVPLLCARWGGRVLLLAPVGLLLALLGTVAAPVLRWAVVHVPAAGLLRDGQKWIAPVVLLVAMALGCAVERIAGSRLLAALVVLSPLAALPGAAWAEGGTLHAVTYPADWRAVTAQASGRVLVLPWALYRDFPWDGGTPVLDPATKLLARPVVDDALPLAATRVRGEDPLAASLDGAASSGQPLLGALRGKGIDEVLVERTAAGADSAVLARQTSGLALVASTDELALYAVPGAGQVGDDDVPWEPVAAADLVAVGLVLSAVRPRRARR